jgi:hypothetical protein
MSNETNETTTPTPRTRTNKDVDVRELLKDPEALVAALQGLPDAKLNRAIGGALNAARKAKEAELKANPEYKAAKERVKMADKVYDDAVKNAQTDADGKMVIDVVIEGMEEELSKKVLERENLLENLNDGSDGKPVGFIVSNRAEARQRLNALTTKILGKSTEVPA